MKPNKILAVLVVLTAMTCSTAYAQLYKPDYTTKLVLAGNGGIETPFAITLKAPPLSGNSFNLILPATVGSAGFMLTTDGTTGQLSWTDPSSGITLGGDVIGTAGTNTIAHTVQAGNNIVAALNSPATPKSMNAEVINYDATLKVNASHQLGFDLNNQNTWLATQTFTTTAAQSDVFVNSINGGGTSLINIAHGGTNSFATPTAGAIAYGSGTAYAFSAAGTTGQVLLSGGNGSPTWADLSSLGITSIIGTAPIVANTVSGVATISLTQGDLKTTSPGITITGTGKTVGADLNVNLNTGNLTPAAGGALAVTNGTGSVIGTGTTVTLNNDATLTQTGGNLGIALNHDNTWNSTQTYGGVGKGIVVGTNGTTLDATLTVNGDKGFKYVDGHQTAGFILTEDGSGNATWKDPATGLVVTMGGDISGLSNASSVDKLKGKSLDYTGLADASILVYNNGTSSWVSKNLSQDVTITNAGVASVNSVQTAAGPSIAAAINTNIPANAINGNQISHDLTLTTGGATPFALGIDLTHANNWTGTQTITGAGKFVYVDGNQGALKAGWVLTEDAAGVATWADPGSSVNLGGDVTGPANNNQIAATAPAGNHAVAAINLATNNTLNADVLKIDPTLKVTTNQLGIDLNHANTWGGTGSQTFGATAQTATAIATGSTLAIGTSGTLYRINGATQTVNGMANGVDGRKVTLTNTGNGYITLAPSAAGADSFIIPGSTTGGDPVVMGPNATVMLQYDSTVSGWRLIGGF